MNFRLGRRTRGGVTWRNSLAAQLSLSSILVVVVVVSLVGGGLIWISSRAQQESIYRLQEEKAEKVALLISGYIDRAVSKLTLLKNSSLFSAAQPSDWKNLLESLLLYQPGLFSQISLLDRDGFEIVKVSRFHTFLPRELKNQSGLPAFQAAGQGRVFISPVQISPDSGLLSVLIAMPSDNSRTAGVQLAEINLSSLWREVSKIRIGREGYAYLVDQSGGFIAYQKPAVMLQRFGETMDRIPPVASFLSGDLEKKPDFSAYIGLNQQQVIGLLRPIRGTDWAVVVELPVTEAFANARQMRWYWFGMMFLGAMAAGMFAYTVSGRMVRPIRALTRAARQIGSGELDAEVIEVEGQNEVALLAEVFRRMQRELRRLYLNLEKQVAELRTAQEALHPLMESAAQLKALVHSSPDGILLHNMEGHLVEANGSFAAMTGYERREILGKHYSEFVPPSYRTVLDGYHAAIKADDSGDSPLEIEFLDKNGTAISVAVRGWLVKGESGAPVAIGAFVRNITIEKRLAKEKRALEDQLMRNQKMEAIGTMAGGIAHDFNNILMGIIGYTELAMLNLDASADEMKTYLTRSLEAGHRAKELVQQILKFSRNEAGEFGPSSVKAVLKEALKLLHSTVPSTIRMETRISAENHIVMGDPTQLHQVVMNLCVNAQQAMRAGGGTLSISLTNTFFSHPRKFFGMECRPGAYVVLSVEDTGSGIAPELLERIFEPYFTTKKTDEGTGLGLSVTFGVVKRHGGLIEVDSTPGKGTRFSVYLPVIQPVAAEVGVTDRSVPKGDGEHILIVDDELFFRDVVGSALKGLNYRVSAFEDSRKVLQAFGNGSREYDLLITDQTMPHLTGIQLISKIRALGVRIPVILCTGYSEEVTEESAPRYGITRLLYKPVSMKDLGIAVNDLLAEQRRDAAGIS